jgi:hypothetical protein
VHESVCTPIKKSPGPGCLPSDRYLFAKLKMVSPMPMRLASASHGGPDHFFAPSSGTNTTAYVLIGYQSVALQQRFAAMPRVLARRGARRAK